MMPIETVVHLDLGTGGDIDVVEGMEYRISVVEGVYTQTVLLSCILAANETKRDFL